MILIVLILNSMFNCLIYVVRPISFNILGMIISLCYLFHLSLGFNTLMQQVINTKNVFHTGINKTVNTTETKKNNKDYFFNYFLFTVQAYYYDFDYQHTKNYLFQDKTSLAVVYISSERGQNNKKKTDCNFVFRFKVIISS